jgi:hypothetical protein
LDKVNYSFRATNPSTADGQLRGRLSSHDGCVLAALLISTVH